jgi:hypothetical protein
MTQFLSSLAIAAMLVAGASTASPAGANDTAIETMKLQNEGFRLDPARSGSRATASRAGTPRAMAAPGAGSPSARKNDNEWKYVPVRRYLTVKP